MTYGNEMQPLTVEKLAIDRIDVRELHRVGLLSRPSAPRWPSFRWPKIERMRTDSGLIRIELRNQVTPQLIHVSWTHCHFGSYRPWMLCPHCRKRGHNPAGNGSSLEPARHQITTRRDLASILSCKSAV